jgi:hypothetical protein
MYKHLFTLENLVHSIMIAFALASLGNVHEFLRAAGHPSEVAWALAVALGLSLVTIAIMLTRIDRTAEPVAFAWLAVAGVALGLLSGSLQASTYAKHLAGAWPVVLGFGGPICGEVLLAIAASEYSKAQRRAEFRGVGDQLEAAVSTFLVEAVGSMDRAAIQRHVERTINTMARQAVDSVSSKALRYYDNTPAQNEQPAASNLTPDAAKTPVVNTEQPTDANALDAGRQTANANKRQRAAQRQRALFAILRDEFNGVASDELNRTALGDRLGCSRQTVSSDLDALADQRLISMNGHVDVIG